MIISYQKVPQYIRVPIPQPYPKYTRVQHKIEIPVYKLIPQIIEKPVPYTVEKPYQIEVEKPFPVSVVKKLEVPYPKPYPQHVIYYKHISEDDPPPPPSTTPRPRYQSYHGQLQAQKLLKNLNGNGGRIAGVFSAVPLHLPNQNHEYQFSEY